MNKILMTIISKHSYYLQNYKNKKVAISPCTKMITTPSKKPKIKTTFNTETNI